MGDDPIDRRLAVAVVLAVAIGYLFHSYALPGLSTLAAIVFGPAAILLAIWVLARFSAMLGSS